MLFLVSFLLTFTKPNFKTIQNNLFKTNSVFSEKINSINVYPNPCRDYFNIALTSLNADKTVVNFELYNLYGQIIKKKSWDSKMSEVV